MPTLGDWLYFTYYRGKEEGPTEHSAACLHINEQEVPPVLVPPWPDNAQSARCTVPPYRWTMSMQSPSQKMLNGKLLLLPTTVSWPKSKIQNPRKGKGKIRRDVRNAIGQCQLGTKVLRNRIAFYN
ncbi:hypothetical protein BOTCAL_0009g00030 [Botryotinia calthae]|uniref:Uncharacterized protein n=1 Tax=Botryotinia calthae TaxID=38488 RepID=A0A4Y8DGG3_9HELO|nr:hypothetical protein BOTCAL_0009g00030 [Botryotinia calthae]